jgi:copper(I)-binding protein
LDGDPETHDMRLVLTAVLIVLSAVAAPAGEDLHVTVAGEIRLLHPWARAAEAGSSTLVFLDIENGGSADRLMSARSDLADGARLVGMVLVDGSAGVREVGAFGIGPGETPLDPGGLAIELMGMTRPIAEGDEVEIELTFERAGTVRLHADVLAEDAVRHPHAGHEH